VAEATFSWEEKLWSSGISAVAGVDEVGRGAWAGPLVACAVVFPQNEIPNITLFDSKLLSPKKRNNLAVRIREKALAFAFGAAPPAMIDEKGVSFANEFAMLEALKSLSPQPEFVLVDYFNLKSYPKEKHLSIKKGDVCCASIAAASVLAKVYRDEMMAGFDSVYPGYSFSSHKGYGTAGHQEAIAKLGLSCIHRASFVPGRLFS
jgi:ribonuclease HII